MPLECALVPTLCVIFRHIFSLLKVITVMMTTVTLGCDGCYSHNSFFITVIGHDRAYIMASLLVLLMIVMSYWMDWSFIWQSQYIHHDHEW